MLEEQFIGVVERLLEQIEAQGEHEEARALRERSRDLQHIQIERGLHPVMQALLQFVRADSNDEARAIFSAKRDLLMPYEALRMMKRIISDDPGIERQIAIRKALLRKLRRTGPRSSIRSPQTAPPVTSVSGATSAEIFGVMLKRDV